MLNANERGASYSSRRLHKRRYIEELRSHRSPLYRSMIVPPGATEWQYQRQDAENLARRVTGVRRVTNVVTLKPTVAAKDIQKELHRIFLRDAQLDADNVQISIVGDKGTLRGKVRSWFERNEATRVAWSIKGVNSVENDIALT